MGWRSRWSDMTAGQIPSSGIGQRRLSCVVRSVAGSDRPWCRSSYADRSLLLGRRCRSAAVSNHGQASQGIPFPLCVWGATPLRLGRAAAWPLEARLAERDLAVPRPMLAVKWDFHWATPPCCTDHQAPASMAAPRRPMYEARTVTGTFDRSKQMTFYTTKRPLLFLRPLPSAFPHAFYFFRSIKFALFGTPPAPLWVLRATFIATVGSGVQPCELPRIAVCSST